MESNKLQKYLANLSSVIIRKDDVYQMRTDEINEFVRKSKNEIFTNDFQ